jgi:hypothetical protein
LADEKKRNLKSQRMPASLAIGFRPLAIVAEALASAEEEDFEWPQFIDG